MDYIKKDPGHCPVCGRQMVLKYMEKEGEIPYCESCGEYHFRMFNTAISAIVYNPDHTKIVLIQQYGRKSNILVAGYVTIGEGVEETLKREIHEELGRTVTSYHFNASEYYAPSNTLMVNFACTIDSEDLSGINEEIDSISWFTPEEARENIRHESLAEKFLLKWLDETSKKESLSWIE